MTLSLFRRGATAPGLPLSPIAELRARDSERLRRYRELLDFYEGGHFPTPRRGQTNLVVNYARAVVDKGVSYLFGRGVHFSVLEDAPPATGQAATAAARARRAERLLAQIAEENDLELLLLHAATNAATLGDAVLKVLWDAAGGRVRIVNVDPFCFFPTWAGDDLSALRRVAVCSRIGVPEARERYGWRGAGRAGADTVEALEVWTAERFQLLVEDAVVREGPNPYGFIPFVHVPNLQPPNSPWGRSDLVDVIPLNRELDERMSDQADLIRYHADPPVVFRGVERHSDLAVGPGTVWDLPRDADVALLEWRGSLPALQEHIERVLRALYEVAETPRTSFGDSGRLLSGVALETELQPLIQRTLRKRVGWSVALRRCAQMALQLTDRFGSAREGVGGPGPSPRSARYRVRVIWPPMLPRDDDAEAQRNLALVAGGLRAHRSAMDALGVPDPEAELRRVQQDRQILNTGAAP
ncbi:MAG TPA: phage portal protein [bacterium]|nr:phage portal protein [bacterium]